jgi:hypothetical protein
MVKKEYPDKRSGSDILQPVVKGTAGIVPFVGGVLGEVIGLVWQPALELGETNGSVPLARESIGSSTSARTSGNVSSLNRC